MQVESVSYMSSINNPQFLFFGLGALLLSMNKAITKASFLLIILLLLVSILTKESGMLFFVLLSLYAFLFQKRKVIPIVVACGIAGLIFASVRILVHQTYFYKLSYLSLMNDPLLERIISIPKIILFYIYTFFFPKTLAVFQVWQVKQVNISDFYIPLFLDIIFFIFLISLGAFLYLKEKVLVKKYIFFAIWFLVGLAAHLQIVPLDAIVADRWFYFPMIGLLGVLGLFVQLLRSKINNFILIGLIITIITAFSVRTIVRNFDWKDTLTLYSQDINTSLGNFELENGLGIELLHVGMYKEAIMHFKKSIRLFPNNVNMSDLGVAYERIGDNDKALFYYEKSISAKSLYQGVGINPDSKVYENVGIFYLKYKEPSVTENFARNALKNSLIMENFG